MFIVEQKNKMVETEADLESLSDGDKFVSFKLENSLSHHGEQLRSLVSSWTEMRPDVCMITEV